MDKLIELKKKAREIYDLQSMLSILSWDQSTYMPPLAAESRGTQMGTLGQILQEKKTDPKLGQLLDDLSENEFSYESDDASLVRVMKKEFVKDNSVSPDYISRMYDHFAKTNQAWLEARESDDFSVVEPYLTKTLELSKEYSNFFPGYDHIADPLIEQSDPGLGANKLNILFNSLREELVPIVDEVTKQKFDDSFLKQYFCPLKQREFGTEVIKSLGFDFSRGREDITAHPFMIKFAHNDVRITTRVDDHNLTESLFSSIHETGHALYELGVSESLEGTILHQGASSGIHESQSRLWENLVSRSYGFWQHFYPKLQRLFSAELGNVSLDQFYRAINKVERSLVRTASDELTYNLHVIIRFNLELQLLEGKIKVKDLPEAWNTMYKEVMKIDVPTDKLGVLQDIHWYFGLIGGAFQCYTLGNILSCQYFDAAKLAHPNIESEIQNGKFDTLHNWLRENIYQHGNKFTVSEITKRCTDQDLTIEPYINYLEKKFLA